VPEPLERLTAALADRYRIERELGAGGMATVYLAEDLKHHRKVAVKVLRADLAASLGPERFLREVTIAANLQHPHVLPLYDSGQADGFLYYVMPYVEGISLRQKLIREGELPIADAVRILRDMADALAYAHQHGVVHRDIKPENVMLSGRHALVTDFGVAKAVSEATGRQTLTTAGVALGTPAYMAPEQAAADPHTDHRADIYAFGVVAYELLTGRPPFTGASPQAILAAHVTTAADPVTKFRASIPPALAALVMRCLEKKPADRWQSAEEMIPQLESALTPSGGMTPTATQPGYMGVARRGRRWTAVGAVLIVGAAALAIGRWGMSRAGPGYPRTAIAVLPFENLSAKGPESYFAGGLHDELLTQLAKVASLSVRGRTSVMGYTGTAKPIKQIADELSVGTLLEGSVQVVGERLRVNVQLINAMTDEPLWAERYDRTLDDAFAVQSEIAQQIVTSVGATLGRTEQRAIAEAPTANAQAYRLYLQGLEYVGRPDYLRSNWEIAQDFYERAVALDSTFAIAHAALSYLHGRMSWFRYDPSPERLVRQRAEAEIALRLAPHLAQAHVAMGAVHYFGRRDWQTALKEYRIALEGLPNDAGLWELIGYVHRRLGNWDEALAALDKVVALDPRNANALYDLGGITLLLLHRYREAVEWCSRSLAVAPDVAGADWTRGWIWVLWQGRLDSLGAAVDRQLLLSPGAQARRLYLERKPDSLLALLRRTRQPVFDGQLLYEPSALVAAWAHQLRGDRLAARAAFDSALALLDSVVAVLPDDYRVHSARGLALAGLGRRREAEDEARWLQQSKIYREDAYDGVGLAQERATILAAVGDRARALDEIERLLAGPSQLSVHTLRLDPLWDAIRGDPRFQALLVKYAEPAR